MDEQSEKRTPGELSATQRELLSTFAMKRAARMAVATGQPAELPDLNIQLAAIDAAFESNPNRENPLVQENHELKRLVLIQEGAIRMLVPGHLEARELGQE